MAIATFNISPNIIEWILKNVHINKLDEKLIKKIRIWQTGSSAPTYIQLLTISKKLSIPFGYLFLQSPPNEGLDLMNFRTVDSLEFREASPELLDTVQDMEMIQGWMSGYLKREGYEPREAYSGRSRSKLALAKILRDELKIQINWYQEMKDVAASFRLLRSRIEEAQVLVMVNGIVGANTHRPLNLQEFRAFTLMDEYVPLIFINGVDGGNGRLFSLLHEFAHVILGKQSLYNDYDRHNDVSAIEVLCNAVAAEILAPDANFVIEWDKHSAQEPDKIISKLARHFSCGEMVIARKALDMGKIEPQFYHAYSEMLRKVFIQSKQEKPSGGDYYNSMGVRLDKNFLRVLANDVLAGKTRPMDAYRLTNTTMKTFDLVVKAAKGEEYG